MAWVKNRFRLALPEACYNKEESTWISVAKWTDVTNEFSRKAKLVFPEYKVVRWDGSVLSMTRYYTNGLGQIVPGNHLKIHVAEIERLHDLLFSKEI